MKITIIGQRAKAKSHWFRANEPAIWYFKACSSLLSTRFAYHEDKTLAIALLKDKCERVFLDKGFYSIKFEYEILIPTCQLMKVTDRI